jgi:hypothetical protein
MVIKEIKPGDVVARSSYSGDILFRVEKVVKDKHQQSALLRGMFVRLYASAPLHDLEKKNDNEVVQVKSDFLRKKQSYIRRALKRQSRTRKIPINTGSRSSSDFFELPGKVLHLEGDRMYCDRCLKTYLRLAVPCQVVHIPEWEQPDAVVKYLKENRPDILVLTGHDAVKKGVQDYLNMDYYRNSSTIILQFFAGTGYKCLTADRHKGTYNSTAARWCAITHTYRNIHSLVVSGTDQEHILDTDHMAFTDYICHRSGNPPSGPVGRGQYSSAYRAVPLNFLTN